ncbi:DUF4286 domain-containing protein [Mucilaginibacter hurinus]|uniref:DUF4286 domain-containing protein n=1 Tax=Mucilaginibacter hurinus TaxID=2201324 RepID=A0A367GP35_9SPHI|nr:DUF4286 family protein [Mucilaginibacter hurinus]RCH54828.1 DUF4286 domain-containing protein [Mucilaginibacter hurinus]
MIIYNETVIIEEAVHQEWLTWMQQEQIPGIMATGCFTSHKVLTVIDSPNEGVTYCIQYLTDDRDKYNRYNQQHFTAFQHALNQRFANQFVMFNTLMETVNS